MQRHGEPDWTYILYPNSIGAIVPVQITISEGQKITFEWEGLTNPSGNYRIWALKGEARFVETNITALNTLNQPTNGKLKYTVKTGGEMLAGGFQLTNANWYAMRADVLRVRIT